MPRVSGVHGVFKDPTHHVVGGKLAESTEEKFFDQGKLDELRDRQVKAAQYLRVMEELLDIVPKHANAAITADHGKLKTHRETMVTLTSKNLFGLPEVASYISTPDFGRFSLHDRGVNYSIADVNRARPIHYAVVDGVWGMEGNGPLEGLPIRMDTVLAGLNAVAVDRIGAELMEVPQAWVRHLTYLSGAGFGPGDVDSITVAGDALTTKPFLKPIPPPLLDKPFVTPNTINVALGQRATIYQWHYENCWRTVEVIKLTDESPAVEVVRELRPYGQRTPGVEILQWDGRDAGGQPAAPGRYAVHTRSYSLRTQVRHSDSINWIDIVS